MDVPPWLAELLWWGTGLSLLTLLATVVAVPWIVSRLPADYVSAVR